MCFEVMSIVLNNQNYDTARWQEQSGPDGKKKSNAAKSKVSRAHVTKINPMGTKNVKSLEFKI